MCKQLAALPKIDSRGVNGNSRVVVFACKPWPFGFFAARNPSFDDFGTEATILLNRQKRN